MTTRHMLRSAASAALLLLAASASASADMRPGNNETATAPLVPVKLPIGLPDLVITGIGRDVENPTTKIFVTVTNQGGMASAATNLKSMRLVGSQATVEGKPVPAVLPGQSQVVLVNLGGTIAGATHIYLRVDDPNQVTETNEGNNSYQVK